jgi:hypothetical protein
MRKFLAVIGVLLMVAVLTAAPVAWAADVQAKVQNLDKSGKWLTLDTELKLMIPTNVQVDKQALQPGTDVGPPPPKCLLCGGLHLDCCDDVLAARRWEFLHVPSARRPSRRSRCRARPSPPRPA